MGVGGGGRGVGGGGADGTTAEYNHLLAYTVLRVYIYFFLVA